MDVGLRRLVFERACGKCEYCMMPSDSDPLAFCIDHIIAQQHAGPTIESNLALSCFSCNTHKGPNITGLDPENGLLTRLFPLTPALGRPRPVDAVTSHRAPYALSTYNHPTHDCSHVDNACVRAMIE